MHHVQCLILLILALTTCTGCASFDSLVQGLNARGDRACVQASGAYGFFASARVLIATGGASLEECGTVLR